VEYESEVAKRANEHKVQLDLQKDQQMLQAKEQMREERRKRDE
jgi:hypothetical protein